MKHHGWTVWYFLYGISLIGVNCSTLMKPEAVYGESCNETINCKFEDGLQCSKDKNICECRKTQINKSGYEVLKFDSVLKKCVSQLGSYCVYKKINAEKDLGWEPVKMHCTEHANCDLVTGKCSCDAGYFQRNGICVLRKTYGDSCLKEENNCVVIQHLKCDEETLLCNCTNSFYNTNERKCVLKAGDDCESTIRHQTYYSGYTYSGPLCTENSECEYDNDNYIKGFIVRYHCTCKSEYSNQLGICKPVKLFGETCNDLENCSRNLKCEDAKCVCKYSYQIYNREKGKCVQKVGVSAEREEYGAREGVREPDCPPSSNYEHRTQTCSPCAPSAYYESNGNCLPRLSFGNSCVNDTKDSCLPNLICKNETCQCNEDKVFDSSKGTCVIGLGALCTSIFGINENSIAPCVTNAFCHRGICRCKSEYQENSGSCGFVGVVCDNKTSVYSDVHSQCVGLAGQMCVEGRCVDSAICTNGTCECNKPEYYRDPQTNFCKLKIMYLEECYNTYECLQTEFFDLECREGICDCRKGFKYDRARKYIYKELKVKSGRIEALEGEFDNRYIHQCVPKRKTSCRGYCEGDSICGARILPSLNAFEYTYCL